MKLYVGNLPYSTTEESLSTTFSEFGEVVSASVIKDKLTGRSKGFAFVEMADSDGGQSAIDGMNGKPFAGRNITVSEARPRDARPAYRPR